MGKPDKIAEHRQRVAAILADQQKQQKLAEEANQLRYERNAALAERRRQELHEAFLKTPEGIVWKARNALLEALAVRKKQVFEMISEHANARNALYLAGFKVGMIVKAQGDIEPVLHHHTNQKHYKIAIAPFFPQQKFDDAANIVSQALRRVLELPELDMPEPHWVLTDNPDVMRKHRGIVAYCNNPMMDGQEARIVVLNEKSCVIQPIAKIRK